MVTPRHTSGPLVKCFYCEGECKITLDSSGRKKDCDECMGIGVIPLEKYIDFEADALLVGVDAAIMQLPSIVKKGQRLSRDELADDQAQWVIIHKQICDKMMEIFNRGRNTPIKLNIGDAVEDSHAEEVQ